MKERRTLAATEHMQATVVSYDPSGRFVITAKTQPMVASNMVAAATPTKTGITAADREAIENLNTALQHQSLPRSTTKGQHGPHDFA